MNTYVYQSDNQYIMIDTGYENSFKNVEKKLNKNHIDIQDIKYIFLTHAHDDHAGFLKEILDKNKNIQVIMSDLSFETLKRGQNSFNGGCSTLLALIFCKLMGFVGNAEHKFPALDESYKNRFIEITKDNQHELENILGGNILFTPGHTKDSISLKIDNKILCGDAAMNGIPSINRMIIWIEDKLQYEKSWELLIHENAEWIYPAHGKPFHKNDLIQYKSKIKNIKLYPLK